MSGRNTLIMKKTNKGKMPDEKKDRKNQQNDDLKYLVEDIKSIYELGEDMWLIYAN